MRVRRSNHQCYNFYMTETIPTLQTPSYDECGIVATFSEESLANLSALQKQLGTILGDSIWLTPTQALHGTLMEIICDIDYRDVSRKDLFSDWHERYNQMVIETLAEFSPFEITFSELEISPRAIIIKSADSAIFNNIRAKLLSRINLPNGTKQPPDITHCTIARYNDALNLDEVTERTNMLGVNFSERIADFKLLRDLGPPSFEPKMLEKYELLA
jgi:hypothetical protein